jgi:hypothetical protein
VEFILYNDQGYLLAPNPFRDFTRISIPNEEQEECQLSIYSINGMKVLEMSSTQDDFIIHRQDLGPGIHLFRIEKNGETFLTGKLLPY